MDYNSANFCGNTQLARVIQVQLRISKKAPEFPYKEYLGQGSGLTSRSLHMDKDTGAFVFLIDLPFSC